jgi:Zn-finger nucleic acid-binding protein
MDCPVCENSAMVTLELADIEVDYCFECGGIWLDAGELELLLNDPQKAQMLLDSFKINKKSEEETRKCPICFKKMQKIDVGKSRKTLLIDKCPKLHGLWFDKGELEDIIATADLDEDNKIKNILAEMFDKEKT